MGWLSRSSATRVRWTWRASPGSRSSLGSRAAHTGAAPARAPSHRLVIRLSIAKYATWFSFGKYWLVGRGHSETNSIAASLKNARLDSRSFLIFSICRAIELACILQHSAYNTIPFRVFLKSGFGVWSVGSADRPHPNSFFFPPKGRESRSQLAGHSEV